MSCPEHPAHDAQRPPTLTRAPWDTKGSTAPLSSLVTNLYPACSKSGSPNDCKANSEAVSVIEPSRATAEGFAFCRPRFCLETRADGRRNGAASLSAT